MNKKFILFGFILLFCSSVFAAPLNLKLDDSNFSEIDSLEYLYLFLDKNESTNKISYEITYLSKNSVIFELYLEYENFNERICYYDLNHQSYDKKYEKITCEVDKLGEGEYKFKAYLKDENGEILSELYNKEYIFDDISASHRFIEDGDKTHIILQIRGHKEGFMIGSDIPSEVIADLNSKNKDELIYSELDYKIIRSNPLIAWSVDEIPKDINYTINKKISLEDREKFKVEFVESKSFKLFNYLIFILIGVILFFIFRPIFKK